MTGFLTAASVGSRVKALRKLRGIKSQVALVALIGSPNVTDATIQNLEAGRRIDLTISQLLNIAIALRVPPIFLLAPVGNPNAGLDLPNLSADFEDMDVAEFDSWFSGGPNGEYRWKSAAEESERNQLEAMRSLRAALRERERLHTARQLEQDLNPQSPMLADAGSRISELSARIESLISYLESAGWSARNWAADHG